MSKTTSDSAVEQARGKAREFEKQVERLKTKLRCELFNGNFLTFKESESFFAAKTYLGSMTFESAGSQFSLAGKTIHKLTGYAGIVNHVIFLPDGNLASCSNDQTIKVWNMGNDQLLYELTGHADYVRALASLKNGWLASASDDQSIMVWDLDKRAVVRKFEGHTNWIFSLEALPSGNLASFSCDDTIKIWDPCAAKDCLLRTMQGHETNYYSCRSGILSNGNLITCSCKQSDADLSVLRVWNPETGELVKSLTTHSPFARSLTVLASDQIAVGFQDGEISIYDLAKQVPVQTIEKCHRGQGSVWSLVQLGEDYLLSGGSSSDPTIKIWDLFSGKLVKTISKVHSNTIKSISISLDGRLLASGSADYTIKIISLTKVF